MRWEDSTHPLEMLTQPLCVFCSSSHTEKELLNWQVDHIKDISPDDLPYITRHLYRYVERALKTLQEEIYELKKKSDTQREETDSR